MQRNIHCVCVISNSCATKSFIHKSAVSRVRCPQVVPLERSYLFCDFSLCEVSPANAVLRHFEFGWTIPRWTKISVFLYSTGIFDDRCIFYDARGSYDKTLRQSVFSTGS